MLLPLLLNLQMAAPQRTLWGGDRTEFARRELEAMEEEEITTILQQIAPTILRDFDGQ